MGGKIGGQVVLQFVGGYLAHEPMLIIRVVLVCHLNPERRNRRT